MSVAISRRSAVFLALALFLPGLSGCGYGSKVESGNIEVYYKDGATKAEADRLAAYLAKQWGAAGDRRSVQLTKNGGKYQFRMVVKKGFENNPAFLAEVPVISARLSRDVLEGGEVEFHVCDETLKTLKTIPMRDDMRSAFALNRIEVFYAPSVTKDEVEAFANHVKADAGDAKELSFTLTRRGDVVEVRMPVDSNLLNDPGTEASLRADLKRVSANVFKGAPVELHLCDIYLNVQKVLKP